MRTDRSVQGRADDRVVRRLHDVAQPPARLLSPLPVGDILDESREHGLAAWKLDCPMNCPICDPIAAIRFRRSSFGCLMPVLRNSMTPAMLPPCKMGKATAARNPASEANCARGKLEPWVKSVKSATQAEAPVADPTGKTLAGRERHLRAGDGEVGDSEALCGPGIDQPEHPWVPVPSPDLAELPAEGPADGFEESRCRQGERCRLGQHPSDGVLDHEPQPGPSAAAHLGPRGPPIGGRSRGVGLSVARAAYRLLRLGRAFLRVPQACFALPLTCWAPPMISWLGFSEARPTFLLNRTP